MQAISRISHVFLPRFTPKYAPNFHLSDRLSAYGRLSTHGAYRIIALAPIYEEEATYVFPGVGSAINIYFEPIYRVVLHFTQWPDNQEVTRRVKRAVPVITLPDARRVVENAAMHGTSIVVTAPLEDASLYEMRLTQAGLKVTLDIA